MKKEKREIIQISYGIIAFILLYFFIYLCTNVKTDVFTDRQQEGYEYLTEYESNIVKDKEAPIGVKMQYKLSLQDIPEGGACLMFYSVHQSVEVYLEKELLYRMKPSAGNAFGKTPGCTWNQVPLYVADAGKEVTVNLIPAYETVLESTPEFYFGSRFDIWMTLIKQELLPIIMSILAIVVGIIFIVFILYNRQNKEIDKSLFMLGCFSICIGIWKWSDTRVSVLIFPHSIAVSMLPFIALFLAIIPFLLYVKELFKDKEHWLWYIPCVGSLVVTIVSVVLQIRDVMDLRESLWMNHLVMLSFILVVIVMFIREFKSGGFNNKLRVIIIFSGICLVGMVVDMMLYYFASGASEMVIGMFGFLSFIIVLGIMSMRETKALIEIGLQAKRYEQMAYHDQLTGLYNRTAYVEYGKTLELSFGSCAVVMCDLNNLKKCNDSYGHEKGDEYIKYCADLIKTIFEGMGRCYRLGGDEFCVLVEGQTVRACEQKIAEIQQRIKDYNQAHAGEFHYGIACGCVRFDTLLDHDLEDTLRRADKLMYYQKFQMKKTEE